MRKLSTKAQSTYIRSVRHFAAGWLGRSPDTASAEDLRRYQLHRVDRGVSPITLKGKLSQHPPVSCSKDLRRLSAIRRQSHELDQRRTAERGRLLRCCLLLRDRGPSRPEGPYRIDRSGLGWNACRDLDQPASVGCGRLVDGVDEVSSRYRRGILFCRNCSNQWTLSFGDLDHGARRPWDEAYLRSRRRGSETSSAND